MRRIMLEINDDSKVDSLISIFADLPFVTAHVLDDKKAWSGELLGLRNPVKVDNFRVFTREELHER
jgi:hypothetical protein